MSFDNAICALYSSEEFLLTYVELTCMALHWLNRLGTLHGAEEGFLVFS